jgi:hypothetical protein
MGGNIAERYHNAMTKGAGDLWVSLSLTRPTYWHGHSWNDVIRAMSDHRPVWFRVDYQAADLD